MEMIGVGHLQKVTMVFEQYLDIRECSIISYKNLNLRYLKKILNVGYWLVTVDLAGGTL